MITVKKRKKKCIYLYISEKRMYASNRIFGIYCSQNKNTSKKFSSFTYIKRINFSYKILSYSTYRSKSKFAQLISARYTLIECDCISIQTRAFNNRYDAQNCVICIEIFKDQIQKKKKKLFGSQEKSVAIDSRSIKKQSLRLYVINVAILPFIGVVIIH